MRKYVIMIPLIFAMSSCTSSSIIRTSSNTAIIKTSAAPICGGEGAARAGEKQAAVETIRAGYDRYIIVNAISENNVETTRLPGQYNTYGSARSYGNYGTFNATTTYQPGPTIVHGSHDQTFSIVMFKEGEKGADRALSARDVLGPKWQVIVKEGVNVCTS